MRPGILTRLSFDFLGIGVFEERPQFGAERGKMIEQLRICKILRSRNVWVLIDGSDPRLENLLSMREHKIGKTSDCWAREPSLIVTSDGGILLILLRM
jgi:hypothetical protein